MSGLDSEVGLLLLVRITTLFQGDETSSLACHFVVKDFQRTRELDVRWTETCPVYRGTSGRPYNMNQIDGQCALSSNRTM